jgi:hypothetical protein
MPDVKIKACRVCGRPFAAEPSRNRSYRRTCGPACQVTALSRLIEAMTVARDRLAAKLAADEGTPSSPAWSAMRRERCELHRGWWHPFGSLVGGCSPRVRGGPISRYARALRRVDG